ncbi:MAG TPA: ABC transporter ATP-binding protein [Solirubrobacteraceae bacterium]
MPTLVELRAVRKRYGWGRPWVLRDVDVGVEPGVVIEVSGANGAGKSTLLRILAGATLPSAGRRRAAPEVSVGYAPETLTPPPSFAAADYLGHHVRLRGLDAPEGARQVEALAQTLNFQGLLGERLDALYKGSLQKVALTQALLGQPSLLVLDEPFAGLDIEARAALSGLLAERARAGAALVFSDHREAGRAQPAHRRWLLGDGQVRERALAPTASAGAPVRRTVAAAVSDGELQGMLATGWHIVEVRPSGSDEVDIAGVPPEAQS